MINLGSWFTLLLLLLSSTFTGSSELLVDKLLLLPSSIESFSILLLYWYAREINRTDTEAIRIKTQKRKLEKVVLFLTTFSSPSLLLVLFSSTSFTLTSSSTSSSTTNDFSLLRVRLTKLEEMLSWGILLRLSKVQTNRRIKMFYFYFKISWKSKNIKEKGREKLEKTATLSRSLSLMR